MKLSLALPLLAAAHQAAAHPEGMHGRDGMHGHPEGHHMHMHHGPHHHHDRHAHHVRMSDQAHLSTSVRQAYRLVELECAADVERFCPEPEPESPELGASVVDAPVASERERDLQLAPPQEQTEEAQPAETQPRFIQSNDPFDMEELSSILDHFISNVMLAPPSFTVSYIEVPHQRMEHPHPQVHPHVSMLDAMITDLARVQPYHDLPLFADRVAAHGFEILGEESGEQAVSDSRRRLARRLTEVSAEDLHHRIHLPFGCRKNRCLMSAFDQSSVSEQCRGSMKQLARLELWEKERMEAEDLADAFVYVYIVILAVAFYFFMRKARKIREQRMIDYKVMQAVHSDPITKARVQKTLGAGFNMGSAPSVFEGFKRKPLWVRIMSCILLGCYLGFVGTYYPSMFVPLLVWVFIIKLIICKFRRSRMSSGDCCCCCCCCGATPEAAAAGTLTKEQECCSCCNGTGTGCSDSCCCCGTSCCCCNASSDAAKNGTLTKEQLECCCCDASGCCGDSCCCCGDKKSTPKGRGQKHTLNSSTEVHAGIPIQVV